MKTFLLLFMTVLSVTFLLIDELKAQDPIDQYEGIPLIIYPGLRADSIIYPLHYQQMDSMGVYAVVVPDVFKYTPDISYLQRFKDHNLKVIPAEIWSDSIHNQIFRYTDSHYSIWKAAGVTDTSNGKASLIRSSNTTVTNNVVIASPSYTPPGDTIIKGPGYSQNTKYRLSDDTVFYHIKFGMKIEQTIPNLPQNFMDDVVCKVMVTTIATDTSYEVAVCSTEVRVSDFGDWGNWINVSDDYNLIRYSFDMPVRQGIAGTDSWWQPISYYVQFKIVWEGLSYLNLFVDTIKVYDNRGIDIVENPERQVLINNLVQSYINDPYIIGWYGLDEPLSIDNYGPYRIVDSIIAHVSGSQIRLHAGLTTGWNGQYGNFLTGTHPLYPAEEFWLRAKPKNIEVNLYNYHYPYKPWLGHPAYDPLWQIKNIEYVTDLNLSKINDFDTSFAFSTQAGAYYDYDSNCNLTDTLLSYPSTRQINYHINLGLMYGAKELRLDPFFSYRNCENKYRTAGLIDKNNDTTANYNFFRFTIIPRLNGSFGKELKKIHQTEQFPKLQLPMIQSIGTNHDWITSIDYFDGDGIPQPDFVDVGFFETHFESGDVPYFMVVNRWYNTEGQGDMLKISLDKTGTGYTNYNVTNFIENTKQTIVNSGFVTMPHIPGEARLFKVYPVLKDGGSLIVSETTHPNDILVGDLTIENGVTLIIDGTYYAKGNITVKSGGKLEYGDNNSTIVFGNGKRLIIEGSAEIKGTSSSNKLTLQFPGTNGILIKAGSSLTMGYCNITGAYQGINTENGARSYVNISNCSFNTVNTSISLISNSTTEEELTSQIINCTITSTFTGINVSNYNQILIKENTLTGGGIFISNASAAYLQSNTITGGGSITTYGVFMSSSTGYVRGNIVSNCYNGIHLANSSPDVGGNIVLDNIRHGMFIGSGSIPNLVGYLQINPPLYFPLSGYNKIYENGFSTSSTGDNDGSEIYLSEANILLTNGCNQISDDRESTPNMNTQYLISGSLSNGGRLLGAVNNYWGTTTPTASRFNGLNVIYSPYYTVNCPLPEGGGGGQESFVFRTSTGLVVDTIYAAEGVPENITELESVYSEADKLYATGVIADAQPLYEQIVAGNYSAEEKLPAYNKLYAIGNLLGEDETYFNTLQNNFETISNNQTDTLIKKVYSQNAIKCDVSKGEYLTAISKFDNIIQQNPNGEEAVYAEIDILTTALNLDTTNSSLGKISNGKYLVKGTPDYLSKINDLISSKFGIPENEKEKIIPTEYSLHQNYPNPFNPTTTIKFDLPKDGLVQLEIFDILGRRIFTIVNEYKSAGSYEHQFDASSIASGVYVYKLQAGDFISSKKMILLK